MPSSTGGIRTGPRCARADPAGFHQAWDILERLWARPSSGPAACHPGGCTSRPAASGRSSRCCATWCSPPTPGSGGRSSASHRHGTRWTCRGTRCLTPRGVARDRDARPALEAVLELRRDRMSTVRHAIELRGSGQPGPWTGSVWPPSDAAVRPSTRCVNACRSSSTRSGSTGCTPSETSMPCRHVARGKGTVNLIARCVTSVRQRPGAHRRRSVRHLARYRLLSTARRRIDMGTGPVLLLDLPAPLPSGVAIPEPGQCP